MADISLELQVARLNGVIFPSGVLSADDGVLSLVPAPSPIPQGSSATFSVLGLPRLESVYVYSDRSDIASVDTSINGTHASTIVVKGVYAGPAGARAQITVQRSAGAGIVFFVDVVPVPAPVVPDGSGSVVAG